MKILFLTDNYPPEVNALASRTSEHCQEWVKLGADVTIVTTAPNFPQGKVYPGYKNALIKKELIDGITVIRVWSYITANQGFIKRILDYLSFAVSSFLVCLFIKTDIIIASSPQFFTTWSGCALGFFKRKPWVFELRDLWPESIKAVGAMKQGFALDFLEKVELFLYKKSSVIVALTPAFKKNLILRGIPDGLIKLVPNGTNLDLFTASEKDKDLANQLGIKNKFVISYIGTHGMAHGLDFIISSLAFFNDDEIHFLFIGDGSEKKSLVSLKEKMNVTNCTLLGPIPKNEVPRYLSVSDVSLIPLKKSDTFKTVIPSKIFEAAGMRKPILLGVNGQAKQIVEQFNVGICFEPENRSSFIAAVKKIKKEKELYRNLQLGCDKLAESYNRKNLAQEMYQILSDAVF
jgi:glycosyltransferase involved in cell wall biosynthesis